MRFPVIPTVVGDNSHQVSRPRSPTMRNQSGLALSPVQPVLARSSTFPVVGRRDETTSASSSPSITSDHLLSNSLVLSPRVQRGPNQKAWNNRNLFPPKNGPTYPDPTRLTGNLKSNDQHSSPLREYRTPAVGSDNDPFGAPNRQVLRRGNTEPSSNSKDCSQSKGDRDSNSISGFPRLLRLTENSEGRNETGTSAVTVVESPVRLSREILDRARQRNTLRLGNIRQRGEDVQAKLAPVALPDLSHPSKD